MKKTLKLNKILVISTLAVALLVSAVTLAVAERPHVPKAQDISITNQPTMGAPLSTAVHIVVFEDLKCPGCSNYSTTLFPKIKKAYVDSGVASYTFIPLAFLPGSAPAGNAALCLYKQQPTYFFPFVEYVYQHQPPEDQDWATVPNLLKMARQSVPHANLQELSDCILHNQHTQTLYQNMELATGVMGNQVATPAVFVNGMSVEPLSEERFETLIHYAQQHRLK